MLKGRFRRLDYVETKSVAKAIRIVCAACILHNMCNDNGDDWNRDADAGENDMAGGNIEGNDAGNEERDMAAAATQKRFDLVLELWERRNV